MQTGCALFQQVFINNVDIHDTALMTHCLLDV